MDCILREPQMLLDVLDRGRDEQLLADGVPGALVKVVVSWVELIAQVRTLHRVVLSFCKVPSP
jgi:hypothetical protein